jgi:hypothetical protein
MKGHTMKNNITVEQINELTPPELEKLQELWSPKKGDLFYLTDNQEDTWFEVGEHLCTGIWVDDYYEYKTTIYVGGGDTGAAYDRKYCLPLLNITQMLVIIEDNYQTWGVKKIKPDMYIFESATFMDWGSTLCDACWKIVRKVLGKGERKIMRINDLEFVAPEYKDEIELYIKGDTNDADYVSSTNNISLEEFGKILPVIKKIIGYKERHNWENVSKYLSSDEVILIEDYMPIIGEDTCHSIDDIKAWYLCANDSIRYEVIFND